VGALKERRQTRLQAPDPQRVANNRDHGPPKTATGPHSDGDAGLAGT